MHRGFPEPVGPPRARRRTSRQRQASVAAGVAIVSAVAAASLLTHALAGAGPGRHDTAAVSRGPVPSAGTGASTGAGGGLGTPGVRVSVHPTVSANASPSGTAGRPPAEVSGPAGGGLPSGPRLSAPRPSAPRPVSGSGSRTPSAREATATATVRVTVTATPRPVQGTLTVSATTITIIPLPGSAATLTLTASNGPVNWSITPSQALTGFLGVSPSSGTLAEGASTTVTLTVGKLLTAGGRLTVEPGGITVTIVLGNVVF
jgi:hypothetical protein